MSAGDGHDLTVTISFIGHNVTVTIPFVTIPFDCCVMCYCLQQVMYIGLSPTFCSFSEIGLYDMIRHLLSVG